MVAFLPDSMPHLFKLVQQFVFASLLPAPHPKVVSLMKQMSAKSGESSCGFSSEPGSPQIGASQTEPLGRCRPSRLHAQLLMRDDFVFQDAKRHFLFLPLGLLTERPTASFANMRITFDGFLAKREEREKDAGWVKRNLNTGRPASASSCESVSIGETK